jgi:hypothetical protein
MIRIGTLQLNRAAPALRFRGLRFQQRRRPRSWWERAFAVSPMFRGMGEVNQTTLRGAFDDSIAKARAAFDAADTNAKHYKVLAPYLAIASRNLGLVKDGTVTTSAGVRANLETIEGRLRTLRNDAKVRYVNAPNDPPPDRAEAVAAVVDSINWVAVVVGGALASSDAKATLVKNLAHKLTPSGILEEAGDILDTARKQAEKALGLPPWALPVALGAVGLVLLVNLAGGVRALRGGVA